MEIIISTQEALSNFNRSLNGDKNELIEAIKSLNQSVTSSDFVQVVLTTETLRSVIELMQTQDEDVLMSLLTFLLDISDRTDGIEILVKNNIYEELLKASMRPELENLMSYVFAMLNESLESVSDPSSFADTFLNSEFFSKAVITSLSKDKLDQLSVVSAEVTSEMLQTSKNPHVKLDDGLLAAVISACCYNNTDKDFVAAEANAQCFNLLISYSFKENGKKHMLEAGVIDAIIGSWSLSSESLTLSANTLSHLLVDCPDACTLFVQNKGLRKLYGTLNTIDSKAQRTMFVFDCLLSLVTELDYGSIEHIRTLRKLTENNHQKVERIVTAASQYFDTADTTSLEFEAFQKICQVIVCLLINTTEDIRSSIIVEVKKAKNIDFELIADSSSLKVNDMTQNRQSAIEKGAELAYKIHKEEKHI